MKTARLAGLHIALAAMLLRALLPDGWMPAPPTHDANAQWIPFVICTGHGLVHLDGAPGSAHHDDDQSHRFAPCPFAAAAHLAAPEVGLSAELYEAGFVVATFDDGVGVPGARDLFERRRSRAPPLLTI